MLPKQAGKTFKEELSCACLRLLQHLLWPSQLYQRRLLHDPRVQAALRWRGEDPDPEVRRVAFLLSLHTREKLLKALRQRDAELQRQLAELEAGSLPAMQKEGEPAEEEDE